MYHQQPLRRSVDVLDVVHPVVLRDRRVVVVGVVPRDEDAAVAVLAELPEPLEPLVAPGPEVGQGPEGHQAGRHQQERRH